MVRLGHQSSPGTCLNIPGEEAIRQVNPLLQADTAVRVSEDEGLDRDSPQNNSAL